MFESKGTVIHIGSAYRLPYALIQEVQIKMLDTNEIFTFILVEQFATFSTGDNIKFQFAPRTRQTQKFDGVLYYALQIHKAEKLFDIDLQPKLF